MEKEKILTENTNTPKVTNLSALTDDEILQGLRDSNPKKYNKFAKIRAIFK